jgi:hypothetical protein
MDGGEGALSLSVFTNKFIISRPYYKVIVCAMVMCATTEQHRTHKHREDGGKL